MKIVRIAAALALAAGLTTLGSLDAAQRNADDKKYDKGSTVTLQGCVVAGDKKDTYVLGHVREWPMAESDMGKHGRRMYWIDKKGDDMKDHLGHQIQVTGKITDVKKSEIEMEDSTRKNGLVVEIEGPGRNVETTAANAGVAANHGTEDIPITLLMLKVEELKMIAATCPQGS
jgi:hypothetical protein